MGVLPRANSPAGPTEPAEQPAASADHLFYGFSFQENRAGYSVYEQAVRYDQAASFVLLIANGKLFDDLNLPPFNKDIDRVMICGSAAMLADMKALVEAAGLAEGSNAALADFVNERAFAG